MIALIVLVVIAVALVIVIKDTCVMAFLLVIGHVKLDLSVWQSILWFFLICRAQAVAAYTDKVSYIFNIKQQLPSLSQTASKQTWALRQLSK